jgi:hypothetical protein
MDNLQVLAWWLPRLHFQADYRGRRLITSLPPMWNKIGV